MKRAPRSGRLGLRPAIGLLVSAAAAAGCAGPSGPAGRGLSARPVTPAPERVPSVPRYAKVSDRLCRGAQPTREGFAELKRLGVRTVVCLRFFDEDRRLLSGLGLRYHHIRGNPIHPEREDVVIFLRIAADPNNGPVFVHCREGVDRTGMMVAAYRIVVQDWSHAKALAEMKRMGFHDANFLIEEFVERLDAQALRRQMAAPASAPAAGR